MLLIAHFMLLVATLPSLVPLIVPLIFSSAEPTDKSSSPARCISVNSFCRCEAREDPPPLPIPMNAAVSSSGGLGLPRLWVRVPLPPSPPGPFPRSPAGAALCAAHRRFQTLHRGNDRHTESLFAKLGMDSKRPQRKGGPTYCDRALHCTETELQQAFLEQASKLRDPLNDPADKAKLKELQDALRQLMDPQFRARYSSHHVCSNDAQLHVLQDGGQVSANFNPEHQQFSYVDHSQPPAGGWSGLPPVQDATGRKASTAADDPTAYSLGFGASATAPCRGEDIHLQLRLSFQEGWAGGAQEVLY
eukprot:gene12930-8786_t